MQADLEQLLSDLKVHTKIKEALAHEL